MKLQNIGTPSFRRLGVAAAILALAAASAALVPATAQAQAHGHDAHQSAAPAKLSLDQGRKWATDAPLRSGMQHIRALVEPQLAAAHDRKLTTKQYAALAGKVESEVGGIVANCKLEPKADAMLHLVIAKIGDGTEAMAGKGASARRDKGLVTVAAALNDYARHFDHPGFAPIHDSH